MPQGIEIRLRRRIQLQRDDQRRRKLVIKMPHEKKSFGSSLQKRTACFLWFPTSTRTIKTATINGVTIAA